MKFLSYSLVGSAATLAHYSLLIFLTESLQWWPAIGAAAGALVGALVAFVLNYRITFDSDRQWLSALPRFLLVGSCGASLNSSIVWVGNSLLGLNYLIPQLIATLLMMFVTFEVNRTWTFSL